MKNAKKRPKNFVPGRDLNPGLRIQSQLCLPLDQGFEKNARKTQNLQTGFFEI